jgi:hypothetical protein
MSYRWDADWVALARCLLKQQKEKKNFPQWIWIDIFCIDQESEDKMITIKNSHKIYRASSSYNLVLCDGHEFGRSWILFELAATLRRDAERDEESDVSFTFSYISFPRGPTFLPHAFRNFSKVSSND